MTDRSKTRLIPLTEWNEHHPWPPLGGLRHLVFHAESNGFHKVVKRVGRRVLLDEAAFFEWVDEQSDAA
ncbi:MAG: hypothetical protein ACQEXJ_23780 [Myxococcota bacterium]